MGRKTWRDGEKEREREHEKNRKWSLEIETSCCAPVATLWPVCVCECVRQDCRDVCLQISEHHDNEKLHHFHTQLWCSQVTLNRTKRHLIENGWMDGLFRRLYCYISTMRPVWECSQNLFRYSGSGKIQMNTKPEHLLISCVHFTLGSPADLQDSLKLTCTSAAAVKNALLQQLGLSPTLCDWQSCLHNTAIGWTSDVTEMWVDKYLLRLKKSLWTVMPPFGGTRHTDSSIIMYGMKIKFNLFESINEIFPSSDKKVNIPNSCTVIECVSAFCQIFVPIS